MEQFDQVGAIARIKNKPAILKLLLTACLLTLTAFGLSCSRGALLDSAQAAWDRADYAAAADYYERFLKENPQSDKAEFVRLRTATICQRDLKQYDRAIQHYIHFIEEFPGSPDIVQARTQLGACYGLTNKHREAIAEYEGVLPKISDDNERRRLRLNVADMYYDLNDRGQALAEYQKVVANAPYSDLAERAYLRIGGIRLLRDEYEDAIPAYETVVTNTKDRTVRRNARLGIADCYERTLQFEKATQILEQTEPDPKAPGYIQQRIANIREQQRQRNLAPSKLGWQTKK
ncbi:MAG TPA: tetratricopeptide repeat protein [Blastocatellia bacterium]|nr:tetratricopeptide repeat protein [Blastocatellia bacterium]